MIKKFSIMTWGRPTLFIFFTFLFVMSFWKNAFYAVDHWWFSTHQLDSEALVIGRLVETERNGMGSFQGRLGTYWMHKNRPSGYITNEDYLYYSGDNEQGEFHPYNSQIGIQGVFFSSVDQLLRISTDMDGEQRVQSLHFLASLLTALCIAALLLIIFIEFGAFACLTTAVATLYFQWLIVFGKNLYWAMFLMYVPMILSFFFYRKYRSDFRYNALIFSSIAIAILLKCFSGFEYITTIVISALCPIFYFGILRRWSCITIMRNVLLVGGAAAFAFFITFLSHVYHQSLAQGLSFGDSLSIRLNHALYRLHKPLGDSSNEEWTQASEASIWEVIGKYWDGVAINLEYALGGSVIPSIPFSAIVLFLAALTLLIFIGKEYSPTIHRCRRKLFALAVIVWISFAGTLSWHIFAKVHSYFHGHMNHVLWHIPFTFFAVAFVALLVRCLYVDVVATLKEFLLKKKVPAVLLSRRVVGTVALTIPAIVFGLYINSYFNQKASSLVRVQEHAYLKTISENGFEVFVLDGKIAYYHASCTDIDLKQRFFLHVYPGGGNGRREAKGFDFNWRERAIYHPQSIFHGDGSCLAIVNLPKDLTVRAIRTGQFIPSGIRTWSQYIDITSEVNVDRISAFNLTDSQWINGISRGGMLFFLRNSKRHRDILVVGKQLIFSDFSIRKISKVDITGGYINVTVTGPSLSPNKDGYPNSILVIKD